MSKRAPCDRVWVRALEARRSVTIADAGFAYTISAGQLFGLCGTPYRTNLLAQKCQL